MHLRRFFNEIGTQIEYSNIENEKNAFWQLKGFNMKEKVTKKVISVPRFVKSAHRFLSAILAAGSLQVASADTLDDDISCLRNLLNPEGSVEVQADVKIDRDFFRSRREWSYASELQKKAQDIAFDVAEETINNTQHTDMALGSSYYGIQFINERAFLKNNLWQETRENSSYKHFRFFAADVLNLEASSVWGAWAKFAPPKEVKTINSPGDAGILMDPSGRVQKNFLVRHTTITDKYDTLGHRVIYDKLRSSVKNLNFSKQLSFWLPIINKPSAEHFLLKGNGSGEEFNEEAFKKRITGVVKAQLRNAFIFGKRTEGFGAIRQPIYRGYEVSQFIEFDTESFNQESGQTIGRHPCLKDPKCAIQQLRKDELVSMALDQNVSGLNIIARHWAMRFKAQGNRSVLMTVYRLDEESGEYKEDTSLKEVLREKSEDDFFEGM